MKALVQRVTEASVTIDGEVVAEIGKGYLVLFGVTNGDTEAMADKLASRVVKLRIFEDENGKTNKSIEDVAGSVIVVSQFTLYADTDHGNRPGFSNAARPDLAIPLYERFVADLRAALGPERVRHSDGRVVRPRNSHRRAFLRPLAQPQVLSLRR